MSLVERNFVFLEKRKRDEVIMLAEVFMPVISPSGIQFMRLCIHSFNTSGMSRRRVQPFEQTILPNYPLHHYLLYCPRTFSVIFPSRHSSRNDKYLLMRETGWETATLIIIPPPKTNRPAGYKINSLVIT